MLLPRERIPERTCEQVVDVRVRQVVEQVLEVPKNSSQDRNLQSTVEQIPDDPVLEKAEQLVEVPKTVLQDRIQQRTVEQIVDARVPQAVEELAEIFRVFSQDRIQQRTVEQTNPAIPLAEKIVELLVIQTRRSVNACVQHVVNAVEVEKYKIVEETVQRMKPIIQEKINQETKQIKIPLSQFTDKVVDNPVVAQRQISMETVQKSIETPQLQYCDEVVDVPAVLVVEQVPHVHVVAKTPEIPQLQITDKVIDVPVVSAMQVPRVCVVKKTVEDSQFETVENPETQISDAVLIACLTCDAKCEIACETCVKDNMFMVAGEITVASKAHSSVITTSQSNR